MCQLGKYCIARELNPYLSLQQNPHARILKSATTGLLLSTTGAVLVNTPVPRTCALSTKTVAELRRFE